MTNQHQVITVKDLSVEARGKLVWSIRVRHSDGVVFNYHMPHITWAARAAEYGLDPDDIDTLLDVCLHEHEFAGLDETHPDFVYSNAEERAREALLSRIAEAKKTNLIVDPDNLLQAIRDHHSHTPYAEFHRAHRERVQAIRKAMAP